MEGAESIVVRVTERNMNIPSSVWRRLPTLLDMMNDALDTEPCVVSLPDYVTADIMDWIVKFIEACAEHIPEEWSEKDRLRLIDNPNTLHPDIRRYLVEHPFPSTKALQFVTALDFLGGGMTSDIVEIEVAQRICDVTSAEELIRVFAIPKECREDPGEDK